MSELREYPSGAVRSKDADHVRYDLISPIGLRRVAETCAEGCHKYGANTWLKGMPLGETLNHAMRHIELWRSGDRSEDHLAHAAWNLFAVMHYEEVFGVSSDPDLMQHLMQQHSENSDGTQPH